MIGPLFFLLRSKLEFSLFFHVFKSCNISKIYKEIWNIIFPCDSLDQLPLITTNSLWIGTCWKTWFFPPPGSLCSGRKKFQSFCGYVFCPEKKVLWRLKGRESTDQISNFIAIFNKYLCKNQNTEKSVSGGIWPNSIEMTPRMSIFRGTKVYLWKMIIKTFLSVFTFGGEKGICR